MTTIHNNETEQKILAAANKVFSTKGLQGARMQEIADEAGINKALLHYYFRNKETLFKTSFQSLAQKMFGNVSNLLQSELPLFDKIEKFVNLYLEMIAKNPHIPMFILNELSNNPTEIDKFMNTMPISISNFMQQIENEIKKGTIRAIFPPELLINIVALSVFPFAAKPIITSIISKDNAFDFDKFIESRKKTITEFVINAIKK